MGQCLHPSGQTFDGIEGSRQEAERHDNEIRNCCHLIELIGEDGSHDAQRAKEHGPDNDKCQNPERVRDTDAKHDKKRACDGKRNQNAPQNTPCQIARDKFARRQGWHQRVHDIALNLGNDDRRGRIGKRILNNRHHQDARRQKFHNAAHEALARLKSAFGQKLTLVTQNVDTLLEAAGAHGVLHMHGALDRAKCTSCGHRFTAFPVMSTQDPCPNCASPTTRPDIVWFGEYPEHMDEIEQALSRCDLFVAIGTSGQVYPAAGFVDLARESGAQTLEINLEASNISHRFHHARYGPATEVVPNWVQELIG